MKIKKNNSLLFCLELILTLILFSHSVRAVEIGDEFIFSYTGNPQEFVVPVQGKYKLEVWGAEGGGDHLQQYLGPSGKGGYSTGVVELKSSDKLYIYVGGKGSFCQGGYCTIQGGYNGGGSGWKRTGASDTTNPVASGGGATDIRLIPGEWNNATSLLSRFIVAGGGGGGGVDQGEPGGHGGGLEGILVNSESGRGGTQTSGWSFGAGFSANTDTINYINTTYGGNGGGGGWYGGYYTAGPSKWEGAGGGSGFLWNQSSVSNVPKGYLVSEKYFLSDAKTIAGNASMPSYDGKSTMVGNKANGYAKITLIEKTSPLDIDTIPISLTDLELHPYYENGHVSFETKLPSTPFETTITYDESRFIWAHNVGKTTLEDGKTHQVILMDFDGNIFVYDIHPTTGKAKLNKVELETFTDFESNVFEYSLTVGYETKRFEPLIEVDDGITYTISNQELKVGDNLITIEVSGSGLESSTYQFIVTREYAQTVDPNPITTNFTYTGNYQEFTAPFSTYYTLEVWGARSGGSHQNSELGVAGRGGYSKGTLFLNEGDKLYIYVGGEGSWCGGRVCTSSPSFNGGGTGYKANNSSIDPVASGGGATDIRLVPGDWNNETSLLSRIIVAGGGGGAGMDGERGGEGGGLSAYSYSSSYGAPGTQTSGWSFGGGFNASAANIGYISSQYGGSGAGGGWYGGKNSVGRGFHSAGGGSGFIWNASSVSNVPSGYIPDTKYYLSDATTIAGNASMPTYDGTSTMTGNNAAGYAKISYHSVDELDELQEIAVDKGTLTPEFKVGTFNYDVALNVEDTNITFSAKTKMNEALVTGLGTFDVPAGTTDFTITFTNINGEISIYTIHVQRPASPSAILKGFNVNGIPYENFDSETFEYTIELPTEMTKINLDLIKLYPGQKIPENTIYDFTENEKTINIVVSSEKELTNQPYTFKFIRKKASLLKSLELSGGTLTQKFSPSVFDYTLETATFTREIPMTAIPFFDDAKVTIKENRYVAESDKTITITVDLEGVPSSIYTFHIKRVEALLDPVDEGYNYTGDYQTFIAPSAALYTLEVWGAQGGGSHQNSELGIGGAGGYAKGTVYLNAGEKLYIYVGQEGTYCGGKICTTRASFNGGGTGYKNINTSNDPAASGGGATDIRLIPGTWDNQESLLSRIIVAGGGGGGGMDGERGGDGGGLSGYSYSSSYGAPGTQTSGWSFGGGFNASLSNLKYISARYGGPGAGGGWYGGFNSKGSGWHGAGGGSGFVYNATSKNSVPIGYSVDQKYYLSDTEMIAGNAKMPNHDGSNLMSGNKGNGFARITANPGIVGDAFLDNIIVDHGSVTINFEPWTYTYEIELGKEYASVNIEAIPKSNEANILGSGDISLRPGLNEHKIIVSTKDGANKIYTLKINREASDDSSAKNIILKNPLQYMCGLSPAYCKYTFDSTITNYEILLPFASEEITLETILKSDYQSVKYYRNEPGEEETPNRMESNTNTFQLHAGVNILEVDVTSEDGSQTTTYIYKIRKDDSGNNNLAILNVTEPQNDDTKIEFNPYKYEYYITVSSEYDHLELEAVPENPDATVNITGNANFKTGMNEVRILVTAQNGNQKTYIIYVYKEQSTNTFLSDLVLQKENGDKIELTPTFNKLLNNYTATVDETTTSINIVATAESGAVTGDGTHTLISGKNTYPITVTSESGDTNIYEVVIIKNRNSNSNLLNIEIEGYELNVPFDKDTKNYTITIPKSVTKVNVNVTPEVSTTTYTIRGSNNLTEKASTIVITSIAEDKTYQVYEIVVLKETSNNNYLKELELTGGNLNEEFNKETLNYTVNIDGSVNDITVKALPEDESASVKGNGTHAMIKGENTILITVTSEEGTDRIYTITVNKSLDSNTELKSITNNRGSEVIKNEDPTKDYDYLINVQYEISTIEIIGTPNSSTSTISGNGNYTLKTGEDNRITLRVTAEDNTYQDYIVKVVRDKSDNDDLDFLFLEEGGLSPIFQETTIYYEVLVPFNTDTLHIKALPEDENASVELTDSTSVSKYEFTSDISNLNPGDAKEINVVVTAENGNVKIYTIHITKQASTEEDLTLSALDTNRGELTPTFNPTHLNYELEVENNIEDITITASAFNQNVTIKGVRTYPLKVGYNSIPIFVIGESGVQKDYQIIVKRKKSNDATLQNLVVKGHILTPTFTKDTTEYHLTTSKTNLEFTTIQPTEPNATYEILNNHDFTTGRNTVTIKVTAPDEVTTKEYKLIVTKEGSKNNNLANLEVVGYPIKPKFHKGVTLYTTEVANDVNSVVIRATKEDEGATVTGDGLKVISTGENYFEIVVTSETGDKKVYTVLITKEESDNNYLASLSVSEGTLSPDFNKETNNYTLTVPNEIDSVVINGKTEDINATVNGFQTHHLVVGENHIPITVTSESGLVNIYNITITRSSIISAYLTKLEVENFDLDTEFNKEIDEYFITVPNDINDLNIIATPEDNLAKISITGNENFEIGMNEVHILVTASDQTTTKEYILYVNKEMSTNNYLSSLVPSVGTLSPEFNPTTLEYTVEVPRETESITISATTQDKSATITKGTGEHQLTVGDNIIQIKVKSSIGITRTYKVNVKRKPDANNFLKNLKVSHISNTLDFTPEFNKETNEYNLTVDSDLNFVQIKAETESEFAHLSGSGTKELTSGLNKFEIVVTAEDGSKNSYTINITKEVSSNNYLSSLIPSAGTLSPEFNKETKEFTLDLTFEDSELSFTATPESNLATISGVENKVVPEGVSKREVVVTSEDGNTRTYVININKESASLAKLKTLEVLGYPFTFDPDTFTYEIHVPSTKQSLLASEITAIPEDEFATVNLMGDLNLIAGASNTYIIEVIARDGYTTQEYRLNVVRAKFDLESIIPSETNILLDIDETKQITYTLTPETTSFNEVKWLSDDETIAKVDSNGNITGVGYGTTKVHVVSIYDESIKGSIEIKVIRKKIMSSVYTIKREEQEDGSKLEYTYGSEPSTNIKDYLNNFDNDIELLHVYDSEGNEVDKETGITSTFMKIKLIIEGEEYDGLTIVVKGDLTGDGEVTGPDNVKLQNYMLLKIEFNEIERIAADVTIDDEVTGPDNVKLQNYMLLKINTLN
jgi:hypothetical protein